MIDRLINKIREDDNNWDRYKDLFVEENIKAKNILLQEGEIAKYIFFIKTGCLRMWFNKDGKDITFQFFVENQSVASIDSFLGNQPSLFTIESIEPSKIIYISKQSFFQILENYPDTYNDFQEIIFNRFRNYATLFLSRIKDSPYERYNNLVSSNPEIIKRIPQHYLASYLGITPVSLSRIRNRKRK